MSNRQLLKECRKINNYNEFVKSNLYQICYRRKLLKIASGHMVKNKRDPISKEEIIELSKNYKRRSDFKRNHGSAYRKARKLEMLNDLFPTKYGKRYKSPEKIQAEIDRIIELSKPFSRRMEFRNKYYSVYDRAKKMGLIEILFPISYSGFQPKRKL